MGEEIFHGDAGDEDYDDWDGIVWRFGFEEFFNRFDDNMNASSDDDEGNEDGGGAFDFSAMIGEAVM